MRILLAPTPGWSEEMKAHREVLTEPMAHPEPILNYAQGHLKSEANEMFDSCLR